MSLLRAALTLAAESPNPATAFCAGDGGTYRKVQEAGDARGVCVLADGRKVNGWEYFRARHAAPAAKPGAEMLADKAWSGGTVLTVAEGAMLAEVVAEKDGRILADGSEHEVMTHRGPTTRIVAVAGPERHRGQLLQLIDNCSTVAIDTQVK